MNIFKLFGSVALDGADKVGSQLSTLDVKGKNSSKVFDAVTKASKALAIGVGAVSTALGVMVTKTAQATDRVDKMSQKIGMSRKAYQEWDYILGQNGISVDGLQMSMKTLATQVESASKGNATSLQTFKKLGIEIRDVNGNIKDQETLFNETFSALSSYGNETERTAMASTLLGRSATELAPAMNIGAEAIEELRDRSHELGLVLGDDVVDAGVRFGDLMDDVKRSLSAITSKAMLPLMNAISQMTDKALSAFAKLAPEINDFFETATNVALSVPVLWRSMVGAVGVVADELGIKLKSPTELITGFIKLVGDWIEKLGLDKALNAVWTWTIDISGEVYDALKKGFQTGDWSSLFGVTLDLSKTVMTILATVELVKGIGTAIISGVQTALMALGATVGTLGKLGAGGALAIMSIGVALTEAMIENDYSALAKNLVAGLTAGLLAFGLTKSMKAGALAFSVAINLELGEIIFGKSSLLGQAWQKLFPDMKEAAMIQKSIEQTVTDSYALGLGKVASKIEAEGILGKLFMSPKDRALALLSGTEIGRQYVAGLGMSEDEVEEFAKQSAQSIVEAFKLVLEIKSPSKVFIRIGKYILGGLKEGLGTVDALGKSMAVDFKEAFNDEMGIHSPSDAMIESGKFSIAGFVEGLMSMYPAMTDVATSFLDDWNAIWNPDVSGVAAAVSEAVEVTKTGWQKAWDWIKLAGKNSLDFAGGIFGGLGQAIADQSPIAGIIEGFSAGGIGGGIASVLTSSTQFGELMEKLSPVIQKVIDFFGQLLEPLMPLVDILATAIEPLLLSLKPAMSVLTWFLEKVFIPIISFVSDLIATIYNWIADVVNWIADKLQKWFGIKIARMDYAEGSTLDTETESSSSGTQVSEITGPTRDMLVSLLSPLSSLDSLTGIGQRIYDLLDNRLVGGGNSFYITVTPSGNEKISEATAREIEEAIAERLAFVGGIA